MREGRGGEEKLGKLEGYREASGILVELTSAEGPYRLTSDRRDVCVAAPNQQRPFVYHERAVCSSRRGTASVDRLFLIMLARLVDQRRGGAQGAKNQRSDGIRWRTTTIDNLRGRNERRPSVLASHESQHQRGVGKIGGSGESPQRWCAWD